jgi:hypothetical protein
MKITEILKENTISLEQLYRGHFPDRDEDFWNYVRPSELTLPLVVNDMPKHRLLLTLLSQYRVEHIDEITDMLDDEQQEIVNRYMNDPSLQNQVIVLCDGKIIDGNHRALAAALKGMGIKFVDIIDLEA